MPHGPNPYTQEIQRTALLRSFGTETPSAETKKLLAPWGQPPPVPHELIATNGEDPANFEIRYHDSTTRSLVRFDFLTEWNNLGYGPISFGDGPFQIPAFFRTQSTAHSLAKIYDKRTNAPVGDYAAIFEKNGISSLWFARPVGPVDGFDWKWVEWFFSQYELDSLGGCPVICDLPGGYQSAFMMRIDCDENIASGRDLFELYRTRKVPFSLAIKTGQTIDEPARRLIQDVLKAGGSVVSHSHTHAPDWGVPQNQSDFEILEAKKVLAALDIPGVDLKFVVSPFHQNSTTAVESLKRNGIQGFIGGIACNDPEYLIARSGQVPFVEGMLEISQQCMLHGDIFHRQGSRLEVEKAAFKQAANDGVFFGYLDHPFSSYSYGWYTEEERLAAHADYLTFLMSYPNQWRPNLIEAFSFTRKKSQIRIQKTGLTSWKMTHEPAPGLSDETVILKMGQQQWTVA